MSEGEQLKWVEAFKGENPECRCMQCVEARKLKELREEYYRAVADGDDWRKTADRYREGRDAAIEELERLRYLVDVLTRGNGELIRERDAAREDAAVWEKGWLLEEIGALKVELARVAAEHGAIDGALQTAIDERAKVAEHRDRLIGSNRGLRAAHDELIAEIRRLRVKLGKIATEARGD